VDKGIVVPVDYLRLWVKSGLADSVPWTNETEHQFEIAEEAASAVARIYSDNGFTVVIDHCRNPSRLDELVRTHLADLAVRKILLIPDLETNLRRNRERTNKTFPPEILEETIRWTNARYRECDLTEWAVIDNRDLSITQTVDIVLTDATERHSR
jgi:hypothetical protein